MRNEQVYHVRLIACLAKISSSTMVDTFFPFFPDRWKMYFRREKELTVNLVLNGRIVTFAILRLLFVTFVETFHKQT